MNFPIWHLLLEWRKIFERKRKATYFTFVFEGRYDIIPQPFLKKKKKHSYIIRTVGMGNDCTLGVNVLH